MLGPVLFEATACTGSHARPVSIFSWAGVVLCARMFPCVISSHDNGLDSFFFPRQVIYCSPLYITYLMHVPFCVSCRGFSTLCLSSVSACLLYLFLSRRTSLLA